MVRYLTWTHSANCDCCGRDSGMRSRFAPTLNGRLRRAGWAIDGFRDYCGPCSKPHDRTDCAARLAVTGRYWRTGEGVTDRAVLSQAGVEPADDDVLVGVMETAELAAYVVFVVNADRDRAWAVHDADASR